MAFSYSFACKKNDMFNKTFYLAIFCLLSLAYHTVQAQTKEDYVGITWTFAKAEVSNPQDAKLVKDANVTAGFFKSSTIIFKTNGSFFWNQPTIQDTRSGLYSYDTNDASFILLTNYQRNKTWRYKLEMRNEKKELLLTQYLEDDKKVIYVFTR